MGEFFNDNEPDAWEEEHFAWEEAGSSECDVVTLEDMLIGYLEEFRAKHTASAKLLGPMLDVVAEREWYDSDQENAAILSCFAVAFTMDKKAEGLELDRHWLGAVIAQCIKADRKAREESN